MPDGKEGLAIVVADVSGKAMKAALQAIFTNGLILSRIHTDDPASLLTIVNALVHQRTERKTFVSALVANYHAGTRMLTIASAGHCPPVLKRKDTVCFLQPETTQLPLGVLSQVLYKEQCFQLEPGDFVLFYPDGLPEAMHEDGQLFGYERLLKFVKISEFFDVGDGICRNSPRTAACRGSNYR
jgi:serine phosphatase RsbU (regulator of sigma subunit)